MSVRSKTLFGVLALLLIGGLALGGFASAAQAARLDAGSAQTATPALAAPGTITVVGRGEVKVKPDVANTNIGVEVQAPTVDAAMAEAQARMNAILDALKGMGIATKDIQTSNFSITFERTPTDQPAPTAQATAQATPGKEGEFQPPAGFYHVSNMVQVTIRDLTDVGSVLDTAVKAGANNIWGVTFSLDDTQALEQQAREAAVKDAQARAASLAQLNGVKVGDVLAISEVVGSSPVIMQEKMALAGGGTPVEPGEITFSTQLQIVYAIAK
jgi:uncharacterized protein